MSTTTPTLPLRHEARADAEAMGLRLCVSTHPPLWCWHRGDVMVANWLPDQGSLMTFKPGEYERRDVDGYAQAMEVLRGEGWR